MSYDYEGFRFTTNVSVGAGDHVYAGFASHVDGEVGSAFITIASAIGAMMGLYNITVAEGDMAVISVDKTTTQNNGTLKLSATTSRPSEKTAAGLKGDTGFSNIVTAVDGSEYYILESSSYVVVNSSNFHYELSATQSVKTKELFENVEQLLNSSNWRELWDKVSQETIGKDVDVINEAYKLVPETRSIIDGCKSILGEVPVVTYELSVKNGKDTEAPDMENASMTIYSMGDRITAECSGAEDNVFVYGFEYDILNAEGISVGSGKVYSTEEIRPDASFDDGEYILKLRAFDYSGNYSQTWISKSFTVNSNLYIDSQNLSEEEPVLLTQTQTVEKEHPIEYTLTPEYSGSYNLILQDLDNNAKIIINEYTTVGGKAKRLRSKTMTAKNFAKGAGSVLLDKDKYYTVTVSTSSSKVDSSYQLAITGNAFVKANQVAEDNWEDLKTVHDISGAMKLMVHSTDQELITDEWVGFTDPLDVRELNVTTAGKLTLDLTATDKARMSIYVENPANGKLKKLKSISLGTSKTGSVTKSIKNLLLETGTYYLVVESRNAKSGGNANYSVKLNEDSTELFNDADMNPLDNDTATAPLILCDTEGTLISGEWVGYGDRYDYFRIAAGEGGAYEFAIDGAENQLRLRVYEVVQKASGEKLKSVKTVITKEKDGWNGSTGTLLLAEGKEYIVAVESPKAQKGIGSYYSLNLGQAQKYNWDNNTRENATVLTDTGMTGILSNITGGDPVDYVDLGQISGTLSIDSTEGKVKINGYNASGELLDTFKLNSASKTKNSVEFNIADSGFAYLEIKADSKKFNEYSIALA